MTASCRNGLKGQQALSLGQRPGSGEEGECALKGQKHYSEEKAFALSGRPDHTRLLPRAMPWAMSIMAFQAVYAELCGTSIKN